MARGETLHVHRVHSGRCGSNMEGRNAQIQEFQDWTVVIAVLYDEIAELGQTGR